MAKGTPPAGPLIFIIVISLAMIAFIALVYFTPGESYTVHVTVTNNASPDSSYQSVYIGHNLKATGKQNASQLLSPGQIRTFNAQEWFPSGKNTSFYFQAVSSGSVLSTVSYKPAKNESSINLTWTGKDLYLDGTS